MGNKRIRDHVTKEIGGKIAFSVQMGEEDHEKLHQLMIKENRSRTNMLITLIRMASK